MHLFVVLKYLLTMWRAREYPLQFFADVVNRETLSKEFLHYFLVSNKIDKGYIFALYDMVECPTYETRHRCLIAHHLRNVETCRFEGGGA